MVKNKVLAVGIAFQIIQLAIIGLGLCYYAISKINWTIGLTIGIMIGLYNLVSIFFIIKGIFNGNTTYNIK